MDNTPQPPRRPTLVLAKPRIAAPAPVGATTPASTPSVSDSIFWTVWGVGRRAPRMRHPTKERAVVEATRLAEINRGATYLVLECRSVAKRVAK